MILFNLADFFGFLFYCLIVHTLFKQIACKKNNKYYFYIPIIVITGTLLFIVDLYWVRLAIFLVSTLIIALLYNTDYKVKLLLSIIIYIITFGFQLTCEFIFSSLFSISVVNFRENVIYYFIIIFISRTFSYQVTNMLKLSKLSINNENIFLYLVFPIITLVLGIFLIGVFCSDMDPKYSILGFFSELLLMIANISLLYLFERYDIKCKEEQKLKDEQVLLQMETKYLKELIDKQTNAAKEIHNIKNELFAIKSLIDEDYNEGKNKIANICNIVDGMQNVVYTSNRSIDSLINSKRKIMNDNNIKFDCKSFISDFKNVDLIDLCVLLGNLLDNSIEACLKLENNKFILLNIMQDKNYLNIIVKNTFLNLKVNLETTKTNSIIHGFGLKSVNSIVKKYDGNMLVEKIDGYFIVSLLLKNV